jgi:hypothetical protein
MSTSQTDFGPMPYSSKDVAISESSTTLSELAFDHSEMYIQRIYSDDKVTNTLSGLRVQKIHAEDRVKQSLIGIKRSFDTSETRTSGGNILLSLTSSTDNATDTESQGGFRAREVQRRVDDARHAGRTNLSGPTNPNFRPFWIAPKIVESDESSVSTMTGGVFSEDEDSELDVLSGVNSPSRNRRRSSRGSTQSTSTADDFGSIAMSDPNRSTTGNKKRSQYS